MEHNAMTERSGASWVLYVLGALCAGAIVAAVLVVGPASSSQATVTRTATVAQGVVQSTVSGSGNLQALSQLNLGFKTGGTVTHIYITQGEQVAQGQLLASLDPQSAEVTLEQAKARRKKPTAKAQPDRAAAAAVRRSRRSRRRPKARKRSAPKAQRKPPKKKPRKRKKSARRPAKRTSPPRGRPSGATR
jgi:multidrug efflux pump subunit AcrA (membrane-fusion protein)